MDGDRQAGRLVEELQRALAGSEKRLAVILDSLAEAVTIRGRDDRLIYANTAALARLDLDSVEQLRAADPRSLMESYETTDEHGGEIRMDDLPSVKLLRGEEPEPLLLRAVDRETGDEQWTLLKATAVRDAAGEIEAAVTIIEDVPDELLVAAAVDEEHLRLLREVGMRAVLIVPLMVRDRAIGALTMVEAESRRSFDHGDLEFAEQIAARAALAVESARLYSERSAIARTLQDSLLPEAIPEIPGWELAALYRPAGREGEVGGDFYDFWELDGEWLMVIGDVTGKGVGAAAVTSLVRHTARAASEFDSRPAQVLARIDAALRRRPMVSLCTALCMRIAPDGATLAVGGHPPPLRVGEGGVSEIGEHGTLLGALARTRWPETRIELHPGETLVAFTDGVTDTVGDGGERWGADRLRAALAEARGLAPSEIGTRLVTALDEFQVGAQADDTAVVIMRFSGESPTGGRLDQLSSVGARGNG